MKSLPLAKLGPIQTNTNHVSFGILLPWISAANGNRLFVKIIHERDQFIQAIQPISFELQHVVDADYGDAWFTSINFNSVNDTQAGSHFGSPGKYVYRYELHNPNLGVLDWIIDPFAREYAVGKLSSFTLGYSAYQWSANEASWRTPALNDLILYELNLAEFAANVQGAIDRLDYLADLGINAISVMPVSNVALEVDWGYLPLGYFGVDERFGKRSDFQRFVDEAHQRGLAVIVDAVYGHTADNFPYSDIYRRLNYHENPFMGAFAKDYFGVSTDFNRTISRDFFYTVNQHWLDVYHIDGFRYDCVPNYWDGALGVGYANLVYNTYQYVKNSLATLTRFNGPEGLRLIQIAEQLEAPEQILAHSYSNATWQNATFGAAGACAHGAAGAIENLGLRLGATGYTEQTNDNGDLIAKAPLQYIENHDHSRFLCEFGLKQRDQESLFAEGKRDQWFKVQPYLIGLLAAKGIPMLWQGQEFGENYFLPENGLGRVQLLRPLRWDYFYDDIGKSLTGLTRKLLKLRSNCPEWRHGQHYFYNDYQHYQARGVLVFSRYTNTSLSLIAVNFTSSDQTIPFRIERAGNYQEQLHGQDNFSANANQEHWLTIPSNYGRIWRLT